MNYEFPQIRTINDVLPYVTNCDDFVVADKGAYVVINYNLQSSDTFRPLTGDPVVDKESIIRRECRGIIFDKATGRIIRRPFHKFFNVNEREETIGLDLSPMHLIVQKLDGSMIVPFITSDHVFRVGTKMGETDVAIPAAEFMKANPNYEALSIAAISQGLSPIFEWMSRDNRIVIDYGEPQLILTAVRSMLTGRYHSRFSLESMSNAFNIPLVQTYAGNINLMEKLIQETRDLTGEEGYVVNFSDGHKIKIKSDWYVAIHKAKENLLYERYVAAMILDNKIDDVLPFLIDSDKQRVTEYTDAFIRRMANTVKEVAVTSFEFLATNPSRKDFALSDYARWLGAYKSIIFTHFDAVKLHTLTTWTQLIQGEIEAMVVRNCSSNSKLADFKKSVGWSFNW